MMKFLRMMMGIQTNWYHRYLNLPFEITPPEYFKHKDGKDIKHFYIDDDYSEVDSFFDSLGLILLLKEVFYTPPGKKIPIHTDHGMYTMHSKINITWGSEDGMIQWWKSDKTFRKKLNGYENLTSEVHHNLWANEEDCQFLFEANTNKPSLVNVGILHGTNNPNKEEGRWTLCFVPQTKQKQFVHWNSALEIFRPYLEI